MNQFLTHFIFIFVISFLLNFTENPVAAAHPGGLRYHGKKGKFRKYDTQKAVKLHSNNNNNLNIPVHPQISDMILATRHLVQVTKAMTCSVPRQKVVRVSSCYPNLNGGDIYPSSTILYECSDASGCCAARTGVSGNGLASPAIKSSRLQSGDGDDDELICAAADQEIVTLYFYVHDTTGSRHVQTLKFLNHTSCSCMARPPGYSQVVHQHELLCPFQHTFMDEAMGHPRK